MIKKQLSAILVCLLFLTAGAAPSASAQTADNAARVKAQILKRGTGEKKRVKVKTLDGRDLKGYISRTEADSFDLTDAKSGQVSTLAYRDVSSVRKSGGLSTTTIVTLAGLGAAAIIVGVLVGKRCSNEGGCF